MSTKGTTIAKMFISKVFGSLNATVLKVCGVLEGILYKYMHGYGVFCGEEEEQYQIGQTGASLVLDVSRL